MYRGKLKKYAGSKTSKPNLLVKKQAMRKVDLASQAIVSVNRKVDKLKSTVKSESEYRYKETLASTGVINTGTSYLLNGLSLGDTNGQREGDYTMMKHVRIRANIICADTVNLFRFMLVLDKDPRGTNIVLTDLIDTTTITAPTIAFRNQKYNARFTVLYDKTLNLTLSGWNQQVYLKINKNVNIRTNYSLGTGGTIADISRNALYLVFFSDSGASPNPSINVGARIRYTA